MGIYVLQLPDTLFPRARKEESHRETGAKNAHCRCNRTRNHFHFRSGGSHLGHSLKVAHYPILSSLANLTYCATLRSRSRYPSVPASLKNRERASHQNRPNRCLPSFAGAIREIGRAHV